MPTPGKKSKQPQGESGVAPAGVGTKNGAYGYSARYMGGVQTPNTQGWNSYDGQMSRRDGDIKKGGHRGSSMSGSGDDY